MTYVRKKRFNPRAQPSDQPYLAHSRRMGDRKGSRARTRFAPESETMYGKVQKEQISRNFNGRACWKCAQTAFRSDWAYRRGAGKRRPAEEAHALLVTLLE